MPGIKDKVVVITGASNGIGEAFKFGIWNAELDADALQLNPSRAD
jgi:NADP-dependent 3-hydroxy acid dehydrogenase YdfG